MEFTMNPEQIAKILEKDKERKVKQLARVRKWMEAHPQEYRERKKEYARKSYEKKKAKNSVEII